MGDSNPRKHRDKNVDEVTKEENENDLPHKAGDVDAVDQDLVGQRID